MKTIQVNTKNLSLEVQAPSTVQEYDKLAGYDGACLEHATKASVYQYYNNDFGDALVAELERETKVPRHSNTEGEKTVYTESETDYIKRLFETKALTESKYDTIGKKVARKIPFSCAQRSRSAGPSKANLNSANDILAKIAAKESTAERVQASFESELGISSFTDSFGEFGLDSLVKALAAFDRLQESKKKSFA